MRFLATLFGVVLGAALAFGPAAADARGADRIDEVASATVAAPGPSPAAAGTVAESRDYALREAASPEAAEFVGGHGTILGLAIFVAVVLLIILLAKEI